MNKDKISIIIAKYEIIDNKGSKWTYNSSLKESEFKEIDFDNWMETQLQKSDKKKSFLKFRRGDIDYHIFIGKIEDTDIKNAKKEFSRNIFDYINNTLKSKVIVVLHNNYTFDKQKLESSEFVEVIYIFEGPIGRICGCISEKFTVSKILACISDNLDPLTIDDFILFEPILRDSIKSIISLFTPLDIDLKGIEKVLSEKNGKGRAKDYLKDILLRSRYSGKKFSWKLSELQDIIVGSVEYKSIPIKKIISEYPTERNITALSKLKNLADLNDNKTIYEFMQLLDKNTDKIEEISESDVITLIKFFDNKNWFIQSKAERTHIRSFSDWIYELFSTLETFSLKE